MVLSTTSRGRRLARATFAAAITFAPLAALAIPASAEPPARDAVLTSIRQGNLEACDKPEWRDDKEIQDACAAVRWANSLNNPNNPNSPLNPNNPANPANPNNPMNPLNPNSPNNWANSLANPANPASPLNPNNPANPNYPGNKPGPTPPPTQPPAP